MDIKFDKDIIMIDESLNSQYQAEILALNKKWEEINIKEKCTYHDIDIIFK